jgi:hypothetical protein
MAEWALFKNISILMKQFARTGCPKKGYHSNSNKLARYFKQVILYSISKDAVSYD